MQEKNNQPKTNTFNMETKDVSFQQRVQQETKNKATKKEGSLENNLLKKEEEKRKKEEEFKSFRNKFDYDEIRKKLKSIIENPQLKTLIENMGKEAGLKETSSPINVSVGDFSEEDLFLTKKDKSFSEEAFISKYSNARLSFEWGEYEVPSETCDIGGSNQYFAGYTSSRCIFTLEIQIDSSGSVIASQYGWDMRDRRYEASPRKYGMETINSLDELFEKIISAYIDSLPKLKEEAEIFNEEEKGKKWRESKPQRLKDYKETLLRRKKELLASSLSNKVKDALGLMNYKDHFTEQELKDLKDIENGRDLVDFK